MNKMKSSGTLSRRDFLKTAGLSLASLFLPAPLRLKTPASSSDEKELLGRVTLEGYGLFAEPDMESEKMESMEKDSIRKITAVTIGADASSPNRIWYGLDERGFAHSGRIQLVQRRPNPVDTVIPEDGCLGEITMPYVEAYSYYEGDRFIVYRLFYAATFWILKRFVDEAGSVWYQLLDDRYYRVFYVPGYAVRLVPDEELTAISPDVPPEEKKIIIDLQSQSLMAYEGENVVFMSRISSGVRLKEGGFATPKGYFRTTRKRPCRHMANGPSAYGSGFDLPGVPWVSYFTSDGVALHGAYWHSNFGVPHSHGCINMAPQAAKWIYRWTNPTVPPDYYYYSDPIGTRVIVQ